MTTAAVPRLLWAERMPQRPLCDVPWFGTAIVMSDGTVNFCCHSNGVAGNINEASFEDVWNGPVMREIRRELAAQRLPVLCQTSSCPFFRGDSQHFLVERTGNATTNAVSIGGEYRALVTEWMRETRLQARRRRRLLGGDRLALDLDIRYSGPYAFQADLLVGMAPPVGLARFAPGGDEVPGPLRIDIPLGPETPHHHLVEPALRIPAGSTELCVALMLTSGNPLQVNQCVWSEVVPI